MKKVWPLFLLLPFLFSVPLARASQNSRYLSLTQNEGKVFFIFDFHHTFWNVLWPRSGNTSMHPRRPTRQQRRGIAQLLGRGAYEQPDR